MASPETHLLSHRTKAIPAPTKLHNTSLLPVLRTDYALATTHSHASSKCASFVSLGTTIGMEQGGAYCLIECVHAADRVYLSQWAHSTAHYQEVYI